MRIVIDGRMLYWTGVGRYTKRLLENLEQLDSENEYLVLMRKADWDLWEPKAKNFSRVEANFDPYTLGEQIGLARLLSKLRPDLVHFTAPNTPLFYRGGRVVTVHDLTLIDYDTSRGGGIEKLLRGLKRLPFRLVFRNSVRGAAAIITDTEYVKNQLVSRYRVASERITASLLGADPLLAKPEPIDRFGVGEGFLLSWGNFYPYKNLSSTVSALKLLAKKRPGLKLVLPGKPDYFRARLEEQVKELGLTERVFFVGFVTDGELMALCQAASLYVYPSLSEGFGLQGLESMSQGLPVLAARASCLLEVYGEAAEYFDPASVADQADKIDALLDDKARLEGLARGGRERVKQFSWRKMAEETLEVYEQVG
jgi:glycosyltransferase involved in cell wall biosynthesis